MITPKKEEFVEGANYRITYVMNPKFPQRLPADDYLDRIKEGYADFHIPLDRPIRAYELIMEEDFWCPF